MKGLWSGPAFRLGLLVGGLSALQRWVLWAVYAPVTYGDTGSYFRSAEVLSRWTLADYDGTRVPGYPAFIALFGLDPDRVYAAQLVLGWLITLLLYWWAWQATRRPVLGAIVAFGYTLIPGQFLFEANLLTETLTAFLLVLSFVLNFAVERSATSPRQLLAAAGLGLSAGAVGLVRILFYPLSVWLIPFVWTAIGDGWRMRLSRTAVFLVPAFVLLMGWVGYINSAYGFLAPTTMGGYNLVQHTGVFFEYLPDEYAAIRDTYLRYRAARLAERGDQTNTIWEAIPELTEVSGFGFYDLSRELQRLSLLLIRQHPDLYLRNVAEGWLGFWKAPVYWDPALVSHPAAASILRAWAAVGRAVSLTVNAGFLAISLWVILRLRRYRELLRDRAWLAPWGFIWFTSVVQTIVDHGDNPRFLVPLQAVVFFVVVIAADFVYRKERK